MERTACSRAGNLVGPGPSEGLPRGLAYEGSGALPVGPAKARPGVAFLRGTTPPAPWWGSGASRARSVCGCQRWLPCAFGLYGVTAVGAASECDCLFAGLGTRVDR